jgi:hypothetical protein
MTATITDADNRQVLAQSTPLVADEGTSLRSKDYRFEFPLADLPAGEYVLALRAKPVTGAEIVRHVRFLVR